MFRLQSSNHQAVYIRSIKGNYIPLAHISLQMISEGGLGLTYKVIYV